MKTVTIVCPKCGTAKSVPYDKLPPKAVMAVCKTCQGKFKYDPHEAEATTPLDKQKKPATNDNNHKNKHNIINTTYLIAVFIVLTLSVSAFFSFNKTIDNRAFGSKQPKFSSLPYLHPAIDEKYNRLSESYDQLKSYLPESDHLLIDRTKQSFWELQKKDSDLSSKVLSILYGWNYDEEDIFAKSDYFESVDKEIRRVTKVAESFEWAKAEARNPCKIDGLPTDYDIFSVYSRGGFKSLDLQLGSSGFTTKESEVVVSYPDKPVVLLLSSPGPTVWTIRRTPNTQIAGIIASGPHKQAVRGVSLATPVLTMSLDGKECSSIANLNANQLTNYAVSKILGAQRGDIKEIINKPAKEFKLGPSYIRTKDPEEDTNISLKNRVAAKQNTTNKSLANAATNLNKPTNTPVTGIYYVPSTAIVDLSKTISSTEREIKDDAEGLAVPAGQRGIEKLIEMKKLRLATSEDIDRWIEKASKPYRLYNDDFRIKTAFSPNRVVVLDSFQLPQGLTTSNSYNFIIPEGAPTPKGPRGYNRYYFMKTGRCIGTNCCPH